MVQIIYVAIVEHIYEYEYLRVYVYVICIMYSSSTSYAYVLSACFDQVGNQYEYIYTYIANR